MDGSGEYHPEWGNPITKEHTWYAPTDKWILAQKLGIPKIQFAKHMKLKNKEDQAWILHSFLERGSKYPWEEIQSIYFGVESEGEAIQWLSHLGMHSIYSYQTQTLLWMPTSACWQEPDTAVSWEALPDPDQCRCGSSQPTIRLSKGPQLRS